MLFTKHLNTFEYRECSMAECFCFLTVHLTVFVFVFWSGCYVLASVSSQNGTATRTWVKSHCCIGEWSSFVSFTVWVCKKQQMERRAGGSGLADSSYALRRFLYVRTFSLTDAVGQNPK